MAFPAILPGGAALHKTGRYNRTMAHKAKSSAEAYLFPTLEFSMLRRRPTQRRGFERVVSILDACEELLRSQHFEKIGTAEIAERAGLKIGTLYVFFEDRTAIFTCLIERVLAEIRGQFVAEPIDGVVDPDRFVAAMLTRLRAVWHRHAALMTLYHSFQHNPSIQAKRDELQRFATDKLAVLLRSAFRAIDSRRTRAGAWVIYDLITSSLDAQSHLAEGGRPDVEREWRRAITSYITTLSVAP